MAEGCCSGIAKMLLFIINFCVWIVGVVLIAVGTWVMVDSEKYSYLFEDDDTLTVVAGIIIGTGCFIFLIGFTACCGAIKEIVFLLQLYFVLVFLVVILEVVAAILAFVFQDEITAGLEETISKTIKEDYDGNDNAATQSIDALQKDFDCCGGTGITDWKNSAWAGNNNDKAAPTSCCKNPNENNCNVGTPGNPATNKMNEDGCVDAFTDWLQTNYIIIGGVCLGLLGFEVLAMIFACCLISGIKNGDKYS